MDTFPSALRNARWPTVASLIGGYAFLFGLVIAASMVPRWPILLPPGLALVAAFVLTGVWLRSRQIPRFSAGEVGILVSLRCSGSIDPKSPAVSGVLSRLAEQLKVEAEQLRQAVPALRVSVRTLPAHIRLGDVEASSKIAERSRAVYVISGSCATGALAGRAAISLEQIHFVVRHRKLGANAQRGFKEALTLVHQVPRQYQVYFDNDLVDVQTVASNLGLTARYQIGLALAVSGEVDSAARILHEIVASGKRSDHYVAQAASVISALYLAKWVEKWPVPGTPAPVVAEALSDAQLAVGHTPNDANAWALVACLHFLLGDLDAAERANERVRQLARQGELAIPYLNLAVFALSRSDFDDALRHYLLAFRKGVSKTAARTASEWLYAASETYGEQFSLGIALLNDRVMDRSLAAEQYRAALALIPEGSRSARFVSRRLGYLDPKVEEPRTLARTPVRLQRRRAASKARRRW